VRSQRRKPILGTTPAYTMATEYKGTITFEGSSFVVLYSVTFTDKTTARLPRSDRGGFRVGRQLRLEGLGSAAEVHCSHFAGMLTSV